MNGLLQDLRYALRQLRKAPGFTVAVVITLALGIGLNAAIFTMVDCVLLRPLGYHDADRIVALKTQFTKQGRSGYRLGGSDYVDIAKQVKSLEHIAYYSGAYKDGVQLGTRAVYTDVTSGSPQLLAVMGVQPVAGRLFSAEGADRDVDVGSGFARDNFGSAANAIGKPIHYGDKLRVIVGVLPDGFSFPGKTQVWVSVPETPEILNRTAYNQQAVGKLRDGATMEQLSAELSTLSGQLSRQYVEDKDKAFISVPLQEQIVGKIRPLLRLLMGSVFVVLLIVCANVIHLQLVRSSRQKREIAIRTALGSTRADIVWRALLEAGMLAAFGCAGGVAIAEVGLRSIIRMAPPDIPRLGDVRLNWHVVLFSFALSLVVMGVTAMWPVWRSWQIDPVTTLKQESGRGTEGASGLWLRDGLVIAEVAMTLMLSVTAVLLMRQMIAEAHADLGFDADNIALMELHAPSSEDPASRQALTQLENVLGVVHALPGVQAVAAVRGAPSGPTWSDVGYAIRGRMEFAPGVKLPNADIVPISTDYFSAMRIPVLRGRGLESTDVESNQYVAVISKTMAAESFPGQDPIGKEIMCGFDRTMRWMRIVGVVGDVRQESPAAVPTATFYVPIAQHPQTASDVQLVIRTSMEPGALLRTVQTRLEQIDPSMAIGATTMRESLGESKRGDNFRSVLFGAFAGLSILLAGIGTYGVTAYAVAQRRFEFALRFALGASRGGVLQMVLLQGLRIATAGVVIGVVLSAALMRTMGSLLGKFGDVDAWSYGLAALGVMLIALIATFVPARRAATIEPMQALRTE
ncbi:MAG TPA: ABC transporter permease [Acidobacteriaceae bacterium]|nr:ABC transporter permease [Acidobacteriaceae bacterium]